MSADNTRVAVEDSDGDDSYSRADTAEIRGGHAYIASLNNTAMPQGTPPSSRNLPRMSDPSTQTEGGIPYGAGDTQTISVPGAQTGDTLLPLHGRPGRGQRAVGPHPGTQKSKAIPSRKPASGLDMVVYFQDKTGLHLTVEDGQHMEAGELFEVVMDEMKFPAECREVFSLWLVSDLLELQLKPTHVPFKLVAYWEELLEKYTTVEEDDRERDEPVIMFQRNVFYPCWKERQVRDKDILRMLVSEAREMIIDGRYALNPGQYDKLAGLAAQLEYRRFREEEHTPAFYRSRLAEFYPDTLARTKWKVPAIVRSKESPEFKLHEGHRLVHQKYGTIDTDAAAYQLHLEFMQVVWSLPFYGCAFFRGQIEHPGSSWRIRSLDDDPVWVAVNTEGVFILDMDDVQFLLGLPFQKLSWEYGEPADKDNPDCLPCLFLSYPKQEGDKKVVKMLQVFTKEAVLADAMIEACIGLKQAEAGQRPMGESMNAIIQSEGETWARFSRMCLATFQRKGRVDRALESRQTHISKGTMHIEDVQPDVMSQKFHGNKNISTSRSGIDRL